MLLVFREIDILMPITASFLTHATIHYSMSSKLFVTCPKSSSDAQKEDPLPHKRQRRQRQPDPQHQVRDVHLGSAKGLGIALAGLISLAFAPLAEGVAEDLLVNAGVLEELEVALKRFLKRNVLLTTSLLLR